MTSVTMAIPCYNGAAHIQHCVEAALSQTYRPDEVLVIDDGSMDASARLISDYPVRLVQHSQNLGLSAARNTALANSSSDILVFVDADAYADSNMVEALLTEFASNQFDGVGGRGIEAVQDTIYDRWRGLHAVQGYGSQRVECCEHLFGLCMAYQRSALLAVGGFDTGFRTNAEDLDIGLRLNKAGYRLVYTPQAYVLHQRRDDHPSIRRMMYQWYYWGFIAKKKNRRNPWSLLAGTLRRLIWSDTSIDLFYRHSLALANLDLELGWVKLQAIIAASQKE